MTNTCADCKQNPVDIARKTSGTPTVKLIAILISQGITDTKELAEITGLSVRSAQHARATHCVDADTSATYCVSAQPIAHQNATHCAKTQPIAPVPRAHATKESPTEIVIAEKLASSPVEDIAEVMITDIVKWMNGGDRTSAAAWLATTTRTFGQEATTQSYHKLKTDLLTGSVVSRKLQAWSEIARRLKSNPPKSPNSSGADVLPFKVTVAMHPNARPRDEVEASHA